MQDSKLDRSQTLRDFLENNPKSSTIPRNELPCQVNIQYRMNVVARKHVVYNELCILVFDGRQPLHRF